MSGPPRNRWEVTADRLRMHLDRDAERLSEQDRDDIGRAIRVMELLDKAQVFGTSTTAMAWLEGISGRK